MMTYATAEEVASGFRELTDAEKTRCRSLLEEAAVIIDAYAADGVDDQKRLCHVAWSAACWGMAAVILCILLDHHKEQRRRLDIVNLGR